ncbi:unnamed protein product [Didymodactylos carnosus]|uniref:Uncharacterized protein n=1 Tax=Didymodactylos carnosus TaxID=1234261 RepID=A0A815HWP5_9BILA|nr:unnamed protein product [Didymodactylos carnosus]CAF4234396.1 unnamed protein product [Didymodactylos carnosus]
MLSVKQIHYFAKEALDVYTEFEPMIPRTHPIGKVMYNSLALGYYGIVDYNSALKYYNEAFNLSGTSTIQMIVLINMAIIHFDRGDAETALNYLHDARELSAKMNSSVTDYNILTRINFQISRIYKLENNLEKAIFFAEENLQLQLNTVSPTLADIVNSYVWIADLCPDKIEMCYEKLAIFCSNIYCRLILKFVII